MRTSYIKYIEAETAAELKLKKAYFMESLTDDVEVETSDMVKQKDFYMQKLVIHKHASLNQ